MFFILVCICTHLPNNPFSAVVAIRYGYFGTAPAQPIHLDNVLCNGDEHALLDCSFPSFGDHNCDHSEDAGVICGGKGNISSSLGLELCIFEFLNWQVLAFLAH